MKTINELLIVISTLSVFSCSSQSDCTITEWKKQILSENPSIKLSEEKLISFDFSNILLDNRTCYLGYIGDNYQRLHINFTEINKKSSSEYSVIGNSQVKSNYCDFSGTINIEQLHELKQYNFGVDDCMKDEVKKQGFAIANVSLYEDSTQKGSGIFKGILLIKWYINTTNNVLLYDDIGNSSDSYANNQFLGSWTSYKTNSIKKCAWGHYRIPCSDDLDIGAAEFSVNPKYKINGWEFDNNYCAKNYKLTQALPLKWYGKYYFTINKDSEDWRDMLDISLSISKDSIFFLAFGYQTAQNYKLNIVNFEENKLNLVFDSYMINSGESAVLDKTKNFGTLIFDGKEYLWSCPYIDISFGDGKKVTYIVQKQ